MRVLLDARLVTGYSGGVESVITGLAGGLSGLTPVNDDDYVFLAYEGETDWLEPHVFGHARILAIPRSTAIGWRGTARRLAKRAIPDIGSRWAQRPVLDVPGFRLPPPPSSDGLLETTGADIVHFVKQSALLSSLPSIYHPHDLQHLHLPQFFSPRERRKRELWYRAFCEAATYVAVTSSWTRRDLITSYGLPEEKVIVVPLAPPAADYPRPDPIDTERALRRLGVGAQPYLFYPAQTWPHKNHEGLLRAIGLLRSRGVNVRLVSSGRLTSHLRSLQRTARQLGIWEQTQWLGFVPKEDVMALYAGARAVVVPTRFEAASGPIWEAFLTGVPVACSNVTSLPEQVGDAALVFDPDDTAAMAAAIASLWTDADLRAELITRGHRQVSPFTWNRTARHFRALYRLMAGEALDDQERTLLTAPPLL